MSKFIFLVIPRKKLQNITNWIGPLNFTFVYAIFNNYHEKVTLRKIRQLMRKKLCGKNRRISLTNFAIRIFHKMKDGRGRRLLQNFKVIIHYFSSFEKMMRNCSRISFWLQKWLKHSLILQLPLATQKSWIKTEQAGKHIIALRKLSLAWSCTICSLNKGLSS